MANKEFNAQALVKTETRHKAGEDRSWFECDPEKIFPPTIARIKQVLEDGIFPQELVDNNSQPEVDPRGVARNYLEKAKAIPPEAWDWALQDRDGFYKGKEVESRAAALNLTRLWFTQALHVQKGGDGTPIGIHILNRPSLRL